MKRASLIFLALLAVGAVVCGSAMAAIPKGARVVDFRDYYQATADGLRLHNARETFIGAEGPKGGGKTRAVCADAILEAMRVPGWRGMMFRQKYGTLLTSTLASFWEVCPKELQNVIIEDHIASRGEIVFITRSRFFYRGLSGNVLQSEPAVKQYLEDLKSLELCWFYINEGSQAKREFWDTLKHTLRFKPRGVDPRAVRYRGIVDTNPEPGWFHRTFIRGPMPPDHVRVHFDPKNNPGLAPGYFDRFADMPESWKRRYILGLWDFAQEGDCWVYPQALVDMAFDLELPEDEREEPRYGLDPAGQGADHAALCRQRGPRFTLWSWPKTTGPELGWNIEDVTRARGRARIHYDAGGLGAPNGEYLAKPRFDRDGVTRLAPHDVARVDTRMRPRRAEKFVDYRTEMFWILRDRIAERRCCFAGEETALTRLREQMMALQFTTDSNGRVQVEPKKKFKERTGMSPDELEAVVYANASYRVGGGMTVGSY